MPYANRVAEFNSLLSALSNDDQIIYISAGKAYGITSFFEECLERLGDKRICFLIRTSQNCDNDLSALLVTEICKSSYSDELQKLADEKWGERSDTLLSAAVKIIPYAGEVLSWIMSPKAASPIYAGNYPNLLQELFVPFFENISKNTFVTLFIDGAQNLSEHSLELIISLAGLRNVSIVLSITEYTDQSAKLKNKIRQFYSLSEITFERPHAQLVRELANSYGVEMDVDHAANLVESEEHNIHRILDYMLSRKEKVPLAETVISKSIISILALCEFELSLSHLLAIIKNSSIFLLDFDQDLAETLTALESIGLICIHQHKWEKTYILRSFSHPFVQQCLRDVAELLYFGQIVYNHFSSTKNPSLPVATLLYKLSSTYDTENSKEYAKSIIISSLTTGDKINEHVYSDAKLEIGSLKDKLIAVIFLMRERCYKRAIRLLERIRKNAAGRDCDILYAVLLNSCRNHPEARIEFNKLIASSTNDNEKAVLYAYLTVNYIHSEDLNSAREVFENFGDSVSAAKTYGYFVRNAANAFSLEQREEMFSKAIASFQNSADELGQLTVYANWGKALCQLGDYKSSVDMLKQCKDGLQKFGDFNLHIVYNNLGIAALLSGNVEEALNFFVIAKFLSRNSMPYILTSINEACLYAVMGQCARAKHILLDIEEEVLTHPLDRVKSKYYTNRLLVEYISGNPRIKEWILRCKQYPDRYDYQYTLQLTGQYEYLLKNRITYNGEAWRVLYSPCYMEYWYINPLKLISSSFFNELTSM